MEQSFDSRTFGFNYRFPTMAVNAKNAFIKGEPAVLGSNITQMRTREAAPATVWFRGKAIPDPFFKPRIELLTRFRETYGYMFSDANSHRLMMGLLKGDAYAWDHISSGLDQRFREAILPSDFSYLFGDTIDRLMIAKWQAIETDWRLYMKVRTGIKDFRAVKRFKVTPGGGILPKVEALVDYKSDFVSDSYFGYSVYKRGSVRDLAYESMINDDLDALGDTPVDFAIRARNTEAYVATSMLFESNDPTPAGPKTTLFKTNHSAAGSTWSNLFDLELTAENLAYVIGVMGTYPGDDEDGLPILNDPIHIVVGTREMEMKAAQIVNSPSVMYVGQVDRSNLPTNNILTPEIRSRIKIHYNPMIRMFDSDYRTRWFVMSDLANGFAVEIGFLSGHESPQLFMKASNSVAVGGSASLSPMVGNFSNDAISYKIRMVMGGSSTEDVGGWRFCATSYNGGGTIPT